MGVRDKVLKKIKKNKKYTEAEITKCYKFQRIISSYLNFSEILRKKTVKEFQFIQ